jgi:hypothetical protein
MWSFFVFICLGRCNSPGNRQIVENKGMERKKHSLFERSEFRMLSQKKPGVYPA